MPARAPETHAPDPAVLDYLGRYGEAADAIDPLGFAAPAIVAAQSDADPGSPR